MLSNTLIAITQVTITTDTLKLIGFGVLVVGLIALARWSSRVTESSAYTPEERGSEELKARVMPDSDYEESGEADGPLPDVAVHPRVDMGTVIIEALWFATFDALAGPPDPRTF